MKSGELWDGVEASFAAEADARPSRRLATGAAVGLSALFMVVYGFTGWATIERADLGTWRYDWERHIPFVPLFIIPYMSIDLFFVAAPFLCGTRRDLRTLSARLAAAIVIGGACFLIALLRLAVARPHVDGWLGAIFNPFVAVDRPVNLCPSLHIALRTILAEFYARRARGWWRTASHVWFSLIGFSTFFTYQHHFVDVVGGFILAVVVFYLVADASWKWTGPTNRRVGSYYAGGAAALAATAVALGGWWQWLWWPAAACALAALGYFALGQSVYRKRDGRLPWAARLVMLPLLVGQRASLRYYRRQCRPWDEAAPGVLIGRRLDDAEARLARAAGVTAVVDLTCEFNEAAPLREANYLSLPVLDLTPPREEQLQTAVDFMSREVAAGGTVYVHCKIGYSRSAAVVGAYLMSAGLAASADEAIARLRKVRPAIVVRPEARAALEAWRRRHGSTVM